MNTFSFDASCLKAVKVIDKLHEKPVDTQGKLAYYGNNNQQTHMCKQIKFVTAVLLTVRELRKKGFSIFDITSSLRKKVNDKEVGFTDKTPEDIDGVTTFRVAHDSVKEVFKELFELNLLTNLSVENRGKYSFFVEKDNFVPSVAPNTGAVNVKPPTQVAQRIFAQSKALANMIAVQSTVRNTSISPSVPQLVPSGKQDAQFNNRVQDYLSRAKGTVTMKRIQSNFTSVSKTCKEYADIVARLGFSVNLTSPHPSKWFVSV